MVDCHLWTAETCLLGFSLESAEQMASGGWTVTWDLPHEAGGRGAVLEGLNSRLPHSPEGHLLFIYSGGNGFLGSQGQAWERDLGTGVLTAQLEGDRMKVQGQGEGRARTMPHYSILR